MLLALSRPRVSSIAPSQWRTIGAFGVVLAGMNLTFYAAIDRLPLGLAVTIELLGPLAVAVWYSQSRRDWIGVALALVGVVLFGWTSTDVDPAGVAFALLAGVGWGTYIMMSRRLGTEHSGFGGLGLSLAIAAALVAPLALSTAGSALFNVRSLWLGSVAALFSAAIPFSLENYALRTVSQSTFGVLMGTEPAVAAIIAWPMLDQPIGWIDALAMALVVAAAAVIATGPSTAATAGRTRRLQRRSRYPAPP